MYRNLNPMALGITGRQSELIELALTYGFEGLDLDLAAVVKRARKSSREQACRFIASAGIHGGGFAPRLNLASPEGTFQASLMELAEYAEIAAELKIGHCVITVSPVSEGMPYQENFELHRSRLLTIADKLESHNIRLGLAFHAADSYREDAEAPFIHTGEALLTLIRTIGKPQVGITLDSWDWFAGGGTLEGLRAIPVSNIVSVRLADIPADADLNSLDEQQRVLPAEDGQLDCHAIVQHLLASSYEGPITLWPDPSQLGGMTRDAIVQLARATFDDLYDPNPPQPIDSGDAADEQGEGDESDSQSPAEADVASE